MSLFIGLAPLPVNAQQDCINLGNACPETECTDGMGCCMEPGDCPGPCCDLEDLCCSCAGLAQYPNSTSPIRPLTETDAGTYQGRNRGLYSPASGTMTNTMPAAHKANGLARGGLIFPRNAYGQFDPVNGYIVVLCIGFSNPRQEFDNFLINKIETLTGSLDGLNERLVFINGGFSNHALCEWEVVDIEAQHNTNPWGRIVNQAGEIDDDNPLILIRQPGLGDDQITGITKHQIQVVLMKNVLPDAWKYCDESDDHCCTGCCPSGSCSGSCDLCGDPDPPSDTTGCRFPNWVDDGEVPKIKTVLANIQTVFPNVRQVNLMSRTYGGFSNEDEDLPVPTPCSIGNPESYAFENGFSILQVIQEQIYGTTMPINTYGWLAWGPYIWCNGERANLVKLAYETALDFLVWPCYKSCADGLHPSRDEDVDPNTNPPQISGQREVAERIYAFYKNDPVANDWYLDRPFIILATPASGWWDRREDIEPAVTPTFYAGLKVVRIKFDKAVRDINDEGTLDAGSFQVTVTSGTAPVISSVVYLGSNEYEITFHTPILHGQWTTLQALVEDTNNLAIRTDPWDRVDLGFLPGDVDGNRTTNEDDVDELEALLAIPICNLERMDMDRSGTCSSADVTRLEQLLSGTYSSQAWDDVILPARP